MRHDRPIPLDLAKTEYSYVERPNSVLVELVERHVLEGKPDARILDVGCGAGANARELRSRHPRVFIAGIEPNAHAAELAREAADEVYVGLADAWLKSAPVRAFDAVVLSDVLEHTPDPVGFLRTLAAAPCLRPARFVVSVPNYAVWYNRLRTLAGRFEYSWSGLFDRTHLRFFTRRSLGDLLEYCGFQVLERRATPSLVQSTAPLLRKIFEEDVARGDHLSLGESSAFRAYRRWVEPAETKLCGVWPELLGFQIVCVAELGS
ncbi:MAG: class I SAM-dependent methyltransferase [Polyangiaceae bacterium]